MKFYSSLFALPLLLLGVACAKESEIPVPASSETEASSEEAVFSAFVPGQLTVCFDDATIALIEDDLMNGRVVTKSGAINALMEDLGIVSMERVFPVDPEYEDRHREFGLHKWYRVSFDQSIPQTKAGEMFSAIPGVENTVPVCRTKTDAIPFNDPLANRQWHYENGGTKWADVNVVPVWNGYTVGSDKVIVSVVDGGIDLGHEDLSANTIAGGADGSKNFMTQNTGYRIVAHSHGTHVAGTISAINNNGIGVVGLAGGDAAKGIKGVRLMSCQIFQDGLSGANDEAALVWGADHGALITNNSWGYKFDDEKGNYDTAAAKQMHDFYSLPNTGAGKGSLKDAIDYFAKYAGCDKSGNQKAGSLMKGGVVFFAAGNDGRPYGPPSNYPGCIAVGAMTSYGTRSNFSNYGDWVDICAPGVGIISTTPSNTYSSFDGTSMACPHVTGVAALVLSYCGGDGFTAEQLWDKMIEGANNADIPASYRIGPLVDALGAITYGTGEPPAAVTEATIDKVNSNNVTVTVKVPADKDGKPAYGFRVLAAATESALTSCDPRNPGTGILHGSFLSREAQVGEQVTGTIGDLGFNTKYYLAISAFDYGRNFSEVKLLGDITTGANHAPVITTSYDGDYKFHVHDLFTIPFYISDPDEHPLNIEYDKDTNDPGALTLLESTEPGVYNLQVMGKMAPEGVYHAVLKASDNYGLSATQNITFEILHNDAPVIVKPIENVLLKGAGDVTVINIEEYIQDPEGEQLVYSIDISDRSVAHATQAAGSTKLTVTALADAGMTTITLKATDAGDLPVEASFQVLVRKAGEAVQCYPNPVVNTLYVATGETADNADITIISASGAVVYHSAAYCSAFDPAAINIKNAAPGFYTLKVTYGGQTYTKNFVKK